MNTLMSERDTAPPPTAGRHSPSARRFGYVVAILVNLVLLYLVNVWPGWQALGFLTADTELVIDWVNLSFGVAIVINAVYVFRDPLWLKALGDAMSAAVSFVVTLALLQTFPFDFSAYAFNWDIVVRILLWIALVGSAIGVLAALARLRKV